MDWPYGKKFSFVSNSACTALCVVESLVKSLLAAYGTSSRPPFVEQCR